MQLRKRSEKDEQGFTLIELMVVVMIIAILIAIAIPTFLGARKKAADRGAQSNVRNALTAQKTYYADAQAYTDTPADLTSEEASLTYVTAVTGLSSTGNVVFVDATTTTDTNDTVVLAAKSSSGSCFWLKETAGTGTKYSTARSCAAAPADTTYTASKW